MRKFYLIFLNFNRLSVMGSYQNAHKKIVKLSSRNKVDTQEGKNRRRYKMQDSCVYICRAGGLPVWFSAFMHIKSNPNSIEMSCWI